MILGIFFRNYKSYNNLHFVPITHNIDNKFSMFVGINGVGKSSILEALNVFFNSSYWNRTKSSKQDDTFICPLFLINKELISHLDNVSNDDLEVLQSINDLLMSFDGTTINTKEVKNFFDFRDNLNFDREKYLLVIAGCSYKERNKIYFGGTFNTIFKDSLEQKYPKYNLNNILLHIKNYYSYIYIPVESKIDDILKLETSEMQQLMDTDILETIDNVLSSKTLSLKGSQTNTSVINVVNKTLNDFMDNINDKIQEIDRNYSFKTQEGYKKNLTATDLRDKILEAYFSIRTLKKSSKEIYELSSGEQRIALIDMATAFIKDNSNKTKELVFAIDEPESSLHISRCYNQFKRLQELSLMDNTQVVITTHWYGSIPILQKGTLNHIESSDKTKIKYFSLDNYLEDRRNFPDDINLRSYFELVSTIISSSKTEMNKWLIVEGSDDLQYFTHYLKDKIDNLTILPVNGAGNVIKVFEYLFTPFCENIEKGILKDAKILCIIDSDQEQKTTRFYDKNILNSLKLARLQNSNDVVTLEIQNTANVGNYVQTTIEDCLDAKIFYSALQLTFKELEESDVFKEYSLNPSVKTSRYVGNNTLFNPLTIEAFQNLQNLISTIKTNDFKTKLSLNYCDLAKQTKHNTPDLFENVAKFFE